MRSAAPVSARGLWWIPPLLALFWGLNWPAVKVALGALPPFTLRAVGLGSGALLLLLWLAWRRQPLLPPRAAWPGVLLSGLLTIAVFNLATAWAQLNTSTSRAAVLTFTMPMMAALLAWWLLGERPGRRRLWSLACGAVGIGLLAWPVFGQLADAGADAARAWKGLIFPLVAAFGWAAGNVLLKRWPVPGDRITVTAWQLAIGAVCGLVGALWAGERGLVGPMNAAVWTALGFHIVLGTAVAYGLWFVLAERVDATVAALTTLAVPVVGVLAAMLLVGDRPSATDWWGFGFVLAGAAGAMLRLREDDSAVAGRR